MIEVGGAEGRVGVSRAGVREEGLLCINGYKSLQDEDIPGICLSLLPEASWSHCLL